MVEHIVFFTFKEEALGMKREEIKVEAKKQLEDLVGKISVIKKLSVGINFNPSPFSFDLSLYTLFDNKDALEEYQVHPDHVLVKDFFGKVVEKRAVVDSEV